MTKTELKIDQEAGLEIDHVIEEDLGQEIEEGLEVDQEREEDQKIGDLGHEKEGQIGEIRRMMREVC